MAERLPFAADIIGGACDTSSASPAHAVRALVRLPEDGFAGLSGFAEGGRDGFAEEGFDGDWGRANRFASCRSDEVLPAPILPRADAGRARAVPGGGAEPMRARAEHGRRFCGGSAEKAPFGSGTSTASLSHS